MKYFEDFSSKFGFSDGECVPPDAYPLRRVYIRELNRLAKEYGSSVRVYAYDRPGMHNSCLICRIPADKAQLYTRAQLCSGELPFFDEEPKEDVAFLDALSELEGTDVDDLVRIGKITILKRHAKPL